MARQHFEENIATLNKDILKMGLKVEEAMINAIEAFKERNFDLAQYVIEHDREINKMEADLCDQCALLLAKEQPVASDLRHILAAIKIISQLERIGDHSVHVARKTLTIGKGKGLKPSRKLIVEMEEIGRKMLIDSLNAYVNRDVESAREVAQRDKEIDRLYNEAFREVIGDIHEDSSLLENGVELLFMSRNLERFGDHVTNICEWVVFSQQGEHVDF